MYERRILLSVFLQMLLIFFTFASVVLADPNFRGPIGYGVGFRRPIYAGRLYGRQVPVIAEEGPASDPVVTRTIYEAPAAAPTALPAAAVAAGKPPTRRG
jgi:hypothetical protein